jgi:Domain of unknown function (DUF1992)
MAERKPQNERWESFVERKIREAQAEGEFNGLPGFGKAIPDLDTFDDPNGWLKQKLKRESLSVLPPILQARLDVEKTLAAVRFMRSESQIRSTLEALNQRIREAHFSPVAGPASGVTLVDIEAIVREVLEGRDSERRADEPEA